MIEPYFLLWLENTYYCVFELFETLGEHELKSCLTVWNCQMRYLCVTLQAQTKSVSKSCKSRTRQPVDAVRVIFHYYRLLLGIRSPIVQCVYKSKSANDRWLDLQNRKYCVVFSACSGQYCWTGPWNNVRRCISFYSMWTALCVSSTWVRLQYRAGTF